MKDYPMLYEKLVLFAWNQLWRSTDPFHLADTNTLGMVDNELSGQDGHDAKFGLSTALRKLAAENNNNEGIYTELMELDRKLWLALTFNDICVILDRTEEIFTKIGFV